MISTIECYTGYYIETGASAVCGIVLSDGVTKTPALENRPKGDYLNGLFVLLIERIEFWKGKLAGGPLHLRVHVHHKNANFKKVLDKSVKAAKTARGYLGSARDHIIRHALTRKDYHKPACYEQMKRLSEILLAINDPEVVLEVTSCSDSKSSDQLAIYTLCQGEWGQIRGSSANDDILVNKEVAIGN